MVSVKRRPVCFVSDQFSRSLGKEWATCIPSKEIAVQRLLDTPKVAIVTPFPAPYRIPLFNALAKVPEIKLTVLIAEMKGVPNQKWQCGPSEWEFAYTVLPSITIRYQAPNFGSVYYPINCTLPCKLSARSPVRNWANTVRRSR